MASWWVINKNTNELIVSVDDTNKDSFTIGEDQMWIEIPEGIAPGNCKVSVDESDPENLVYSLVDGSADKAGPIWDSFRAQRDSILKATDFTQLSDSPLAPQTKTDYASYRTYLRDLPSNTVDPESEIMDFGTWLAEQE